MLDPRERRALCIFEFFYLARPDTELEGVEVHGARVRMGERLAAEAPADADLVLPIPDSGIPAAIGFARALGIPFSEGLIKNRYVQRTFIQPTGAAQAGNPDEVQPGRGGRGQARGRVDDSIVRGNTTEQIVRMLFDAGATEVHVRDLVTAGGRAVLLRDRPGGSVGDDRRRPHNRGDARDDRRDVARVPLPRRPRRVDAATGVGALPRVPDGRLPDRDPG